MNSTCKCNSVWGIGSINHLFARLVKHHTRNPLAHLPFKSQVQVPIILGGGGISYFLMAFGAYVSFVPKARLATKVLAALGFKDAENASVGEVSLEVKEKWEKEHGKPFVNPYDDFTYFY